MSKPQLLVNIVCYNSADYIRLCLESLKIQRGLLFGKDFQVHITDNFSVDGTREFLDTLKDQDIQVYYNSINMGFCGAHNQGVKRFLRGDYKYFLVLNPDLALEPNALYELVKNIELNEEIGSSTPLLLRSDSKLMPLKREVVDAAGMHMTSQLRHLDRGSGGHLIEELKVPFYVFGGTGACLLLKRSLIEDLIIEGMENESDVDRIYPQLSRGREDRALLFDEAFFAYREDADLAWRAQILGWRCLYVPTAIGYHKRNVTPEKRDSLPPEINLLGVRNRFLLQLNNLQFNIGLVPFIYGFIVRNMIVILAVLLIERDSLPSIGHIRLLFRRALERRRYIRNKINSKRFEIKPTSYWFKNQTDPVSELR